MKAAAAAGANDWARPVSLYHTLQSPLTATKKIKRNNSYINETGEIKYRFRKGSTCNKIGAITVGLVSKTVLNN